MQAHPLRLVVALACGLTAYGAQADIYTWVDAKGTVNISNMEPPDGVRVTKVTHDSPPVNLPPRDPAGEAARQAEMQALAVRVMQLEYEAEFSRRQVAAMAAYTPPAPVYAPQYIPDAPQYDNNNGCDPSWPQCGGGWSPWFTPAAVFVVGSPGFRRPFPTPFHAGRKFGMQTSMRGPSGPSNSIRGPGGPSRR